MRVRLLSDLHFEFHSDDGRSFVDAQDPRGIDVLVLAGDITVGARIPSALALFCRRFREAIVVYVHGNHEFYGSNREQVLAWTREATAAHPNLAWLDHDVRVIGGVRFVGGPMWFAHDPAADRHRSAMSDFRLISAFESWVYAENARALDFFARELRAGDVVVTHYLPVRESILPEFARSPLNAFFLCDVTPLIHERRPRVWMHGHTHGSVRRTVGPTEIVCNPFGYAGRELNRAFVADCALEIDASSA